MLKRLNKLALINNTAAILLSLGFLALGTGALGYLHNVQHAQDDARIDAAAKASGKPVEHHHHDESNCFVHAQLHLPTIAPSWAPLLILFGAFVAFLTEIAISLVSHRAPVRIDCRGPPASRDD